jgi:hypothetical protein
MYLIIYIVNINTYFLKKLKSQEIMSLNISALNRDHKIFNFNFN